MLIAFFLVPWEVRDTNWTTKNKSTALAPGENSALRSSSLIPLVLNPLAFETSRGQAFPRRRKVRKEGCDVWDEGPEL